MEDVGGSDLVEGFGMIEDAGVAALGCDDLEPGGVGGAVAEELVGEKCAGFWGFGAVGEVRQGKVIDLELSENDAAKAQASLKDMCEKLLANTVIEKYEIELKS